jgi:uncharacterized protein YjiS (DUF1127 family)
MTRLSAASIAIDVLSRTPAASTNPERELAVLVRTGTRSGGLVSWFRQTAIVQTVIARKAERELTRAVARLAETSPHLLADIGILDTPAIAPDISVRARFEAAAEEMRIVAAPVPVAPRPAHRPEITRPRRGPAPAVVNAPAALAGREKIASQ